MPETGRIQSPSVASQPSLQGGPGAWIGQGFGWGLGGRIFAFVPFVVVPMFLLAGCMFLGALGSAAGGSFPIVGLDQPAGLRRL
jgi:hypothetical protein